MRGHARGLRVSPWTPPFLSSRRSATDDLARPARHAQPAGIYIAMMARCRHVPFRQSTRRASRIALGAAAKTRGPQKTQGNVHAAHALPATPCCLHHRLPRRIARTGRRRGPLHRRAADGANTHRPETVRGPGSDRAQAERPAARPIRGKAQYLCIGDVPPQFRGGMEDGQDGARHRAVHRHPGRRWLVRQL